MLRAVGPINNRHNYKTTTADKIGGEHTTENSGYGSAGRGSWPRMACLQATARSGEQLSSSPGGGAGWLAVVSSDQKLRDFLLAQSPAWLTERLLSAAADNPMLLAALQVAAAGSDGAEVVRRELDRAIWAADFVEWEDATTYIYGVERALGLLEDLIRDGHPDDRRGSGPRATPAHAPLRRCRSSRPPTRRSPPPRSPGPAPAERPPHRPSPPPRPVTPPVAWGCPQLR